jgi:Fur family zinc uptake transcriptional regulator
MAAAKFSQPTEALLQRAENICNARGARLTDLRRLILGYILEGNAPIGAYDLLERVRDARLGGAPPTVYRTLDFLLAHGLIHRLERLSAFVGCISHNADGGECADDLANHGHSAQFLICRQCGRVAELEDAAVTASLANAARRVGFTVGTATIEADGLCEHCAIAADERVSADGTP